LVSTTKVESVEIMKKRSRREEMQSEKRRESEKSGRSRPFLDIK
jgi:hypothetical protein